MFFVLPVLSFLPTGDKGVTRNFASLLRRKLRSSFVGPVYMNQTEENLRSTSAERTTRRFPPGAHLVGSPRSATDRGAFGRGYFLFFSFGPSSKNGFPRKFCPLLRRELRGSCFAAFQSPQTSQRDCMRILLLRHPTDTAKWRAKKQA